MVSDARELTKDYLDSYLTAANILKDDATSQAAFAVIFTNPPYPILKEFYAASTPADLLFCVGTPTSEALPVGIGYIENVPITILCIDKLGITGTKLRWTAEAELRRATVANPHGSLRSLTRMTDSEKDLGGAILYSVTYIMRFKRYS